MRGSGWPWWTCRWTATGSSPCPRLHHRPGGGTSSYTKIQNPPRFFDLSATHGVLPWNRDIIAMVRDLIRAYVAAHPAPVPASAPAATPSPVQALGGEAYWLAGGGKWFVHGSGIQISRGPSGLTGTVSWNAGPYNAPSLMAGPMCEGLISLAFISQPDGSLAGTFTTDATYTPWTGTSIGNFRPAPNAPRKGQTVTLTPIAPMYAKSAPGGSSPAAYGLGNPYLCQDGLTEPAVRSCGA